MQHIIIFSGSVRQDNYTQHVATFVHQIVSTYPDVTAEIISPISLNLAFDNEGTTATQPGAIELRAKVAAADAFIMVSPEYNHGYSGSLKYMLDLCFKEYKHKAAMMVGVSDGPFGGARGLESLLGVLKTMYLVVTKPDVNVSNCNKEIVDGMFVNPTDWERRVRTAVDELLWLSTVMKEGRANHPIEQPKS
jgi:NAD(P)H-dependent FMN reductase